MIKAFRILIIVNISAGILSVISSIALENTLPSALQEYLNSDGHINTPPMVISALYVLVALYVYGLLAMLLFWSHAYKIFLVVSLALIIATPSFGPYITNGVEEILNIIDTGTWGAIICMLFIKDVREKFNTR